MRLQTVKLKNGPETKTHTICPISSDPFYIVTYYMKLVNTSWTYSIQFCMKYFEVFFINQ